MSPTGMGFAGAVVEPTSVDRSRLFGACFHNVEGLLERLAIVGA
jgi:hypothetical protein